MKGDLSIPQLRDLPPDRLAHRREHLLLEITRERGSPGAPGRLWASRRMLGRPRLVVIAAVVMVGGLLVAPALGIGSRLLDLIQDRPPSRETREAAWSPDGRKILYVSRGDRNTWDLYVINADGSGQRMLTSVRSASAAWSPDGRRIAYQGPPRTPDASHPRPASGLWVINADGSGKRRLAPKGYDPAWSPDGARIAFAASSRLYVVNADGSGQRRLAGNTVVGSGAAGKTSSPAWSPDGQTILFLSDAGTRCDFCFDVYVVNADGSGERRLTHNIAKPERAPGNFSPAWSPDGQRIAFVRRRFDPNGSDVGVVWVMRADGRNQRKLTRETSFAEGRSIYARVAWSPDGRKLAFSSDRDGNTEVYTINFDGSGLQRLTDNPGYDGDAVWSPDGRQLVFVSKRDGSYGVYIVNADGGGQRKLSPGGG